MRHLEGAVVFHRPFLEFCPEPCSFNQRSYLPHHGLLQNKRTADLNFRVKPVTAEAQYVRFLFEGIHRKPDPLTQFGRRRRKRLEF